MSMKFVRWGCSQILILTVPNMSRFPKVGGIWITAETEAPEEAISDSGLKKHIRCPPSGTLARQMGRVITPVNIASALQMLNDL